jgi:hypothetical protein
VDETFLISVQNPWLFLISFNSCPDSRDKLGLSCWTLNVYEEEHEGVLLQLLTGQQIQKVEDQLPLIRTIKADRRRPRSLLSLKRKLFWTLLHHKPYVHYPSDAAGYIFARGAIVRVSKVVREHCRSVRKKGPGPVRTPEQKRRKPAQKGNRDKGKPKKTIVEYSSEKELNHKIRN